MSRNVELKARVLDAAATLERARAAGAVEVVVLEQRDTYFAVPGGRLKLREETGRPAALVAYSRADIAGPRASEYELAPVADPARLSGALALALGVCAVVEKTRRLLLWEETVRLHLDEVRGLGSFVEIEAAAPPESDLAREHDQVRRLAAALALDREWVVAASYADLIAG